MMNQLLTTLLLLGLVGQAHAADVPDQPIRQVLSNTKITNIKVTPIEGLYEVTARNNVFYSDKSGQYLVFGHLYDVKTQTDLTAKVQTTLQKTTKIAWEQLPKGAAIISGVKGGIKVAAFIDVNCPYCHQLHDWLTKLKGIEVYEYLYPLAELHPNAATLSQQILCSTNPFQSLEQTFNNQPIKGSCQSQALIRIKEFAKQHGFEGTPILIREDGEMMKGLPNGKLVLEKWLRGNNL